VAKTKSGVGTKAQRHKAAGEFRRFVPLFLPLLKRRGQTVVEYLLVTVALTIAFSTMYRVLQWYLTRQFSAGGVMILRMYKEQPW
jgi:hypothetical protein